MGKISLILTVLTAMTMSSAFAMAENMKKPPQDMIERHDRDGDDRVSKEEFPGPDKHFTRIDADGDGAIQKSEAMQGPPGMPRRDRKNQ